MEDTKIKLFKKERIKKILHLISAIYTIPLGLIFFYYSTFIIHSIDPMAEVFTIGQFHKLAFMISAAVIIDGISWMLLYFSYPSWFKFYKSLFLGQIKPRDTDTLTCEKRKHLHFMYFAYYFAQVMLCLVAAL